MTAARLAFAAFAAVTAVTTSGCMFHVQSSRNAPGLVELERPPSPLTTAVRPEDPGERGLVFYGAVNGGAVGHAHDFGGMVGGELGIFSYDVPRTGDSWVSEGPIAKFGGAVGWTVFRGSVHDRDTFGPLYAEARTFVGFGHGRVGSSRFGLGAAFNPQTLNAGPQATACIGLHPSFWYFCTRGSYMIGGEGAELYAYFEIASFLEYGWSK